MEDEIWKDIEGFEGRYQVSNMGNVKSLARYCGYHNIYVKEKILKPMTNKKYKFVTFKENGKIKNFFIHRLVAKAFIPNPENLPCVNHKDCNPANNRVDNLEWCTQQYNIEYGNAREKIKKTKIRNKTNYGSKKIPVVLQDNNGNIISYFESLINAHKETGVSLFAIKRSCDGITKNPQHIFKYASEGKQQRDIPEINLDKIADSYKAQIIDMYESGVLMKDIALRMGISKKTLSFALQRWGVHRLFTD